MQNIYLVTLDRKPQEIFSNKDLAQKYQTKLQELYANQKDPQEHVQIKTMHLNQTQDDLDAVTDNLNYY